MIFMRKTRQDFTPEYRDEAVKLVVNTGRTVATVARALGIHEATLGRGQGQTDADAKNEQHDVPRRGCC